MQVSGVDGNQVNTYWKRLPAAGYPLTLALVKKLTFSLGLVLLLAAQGCQTIKHSKFDASEEDAVDRPQPIVLPFPEPEPAKR